MSLIFKETGDGKKAYDLIPEVVDPAFKEHIKSIRDGNEVSRGFNKSKTMKHIGTIPQAFLYNYAMFNGIPPHKHNEWYNENNGKRMISLLREYKDFRTTSDPL